MYEISSFFLFIANNLLTFSLSHHSTVNSFLPNPFVIIVHISILCLFTLMIYIFFISYVNLACWITQNILIKLYLLIDGVVFIINLVTNFSTFFSSLYTLNKPIIFLVFNFFDVLLATIKEIHILLICIH